MTVAGIDSEPGELTKIQNRPHPINGCLAATSLTIET